MKDIGRSIGRSAHLLLHRLRVHHGIPPLLRPIADAVWQAAHEQFERREREGIAEEAGRVRARFEHEELSLLTTRWPDAASRPEALVPVRSDNPRDRLTLLAHEPSARAIDSLAANLVERGGNALRKLSIGYILDVLDRASCLWLDPDYPQRGLAIEAISRATGFSREMVIHSIDLEMRSSRKVDLWHTLVAELGNPRVLDGRRLSLTGEGPARAYGPKLIAGVFSSNIPALPHLTYMRGLAVKAPVIGKVGSLEPIFAGLYIDTLIELCPELEPAMAALWFPGSNQELARALLGRAEHVVAYGGEEALTELAAAMSPRAHRTFHGHRMGIGVVANEMLPAHGTDDLARAIAYDVAVFDGKACLAPVVYFVETQALDDALQLGRRIGAQLETIAQWLPRRRLTPTEAAWRRVVVDDWEVQATFDAATAIALPQRGREWAGFITQGRYRPQTVGDRLFHLHCVADIASIPDEIADHARHLQNVAIAAHEPRRLALASRLTALGASRVTHPGRMPTPSMMWHHDGRSCLADLVRWADIS